MNNATETMHGDNVAPAGYNDRLFSGGLRQRIHQARFRWVGREVSKHGGARIVELGCFDCRTLDHIDPSFESYQGYDADWEGGLSAARSRISDPRVSLHKCTSPDEFSPEPFDVAISLETLEHIDPNQLSAYLAKVAAALPRGGVFLVSVPNETGILFAAKQIYKSLFLEGRREYSFAEFVYQTLGMTQKVARKEHKGFSWRRFRKEMQRHFDVGSAKGLQIPMLPAFANASIGLVATRKADSDRTSTP